MSILQQARAFVQRRKALSERTEQDWRTCPNCGSNQTQRHGSYVRHPTSLEGKQTVPIARHRCLACQRTYSEQRAELVPGSWYADDVHRSGVDLWMHGRISLRRAAELLRSIIGRQERWKLWRVFHKDKETGEPCYLSASTLHRWLDRAGCSAKARVEGQYDDVETSGQLAVDGLWARLRGGAQRVVLLVTDTVTGVVWPPVVARTEEMLSWREVFLRGLRAGLTAQ